MPLGDLTFVRSPELELVPVVSRWTGNGAASAVLSAGKGVTSLAWTATGKYTLTLQEVGSTFIGATFGYQGVTGASTTKVAKAVEYNSSAKTLTVEVCDVATPTLADLTDDTDFLTIVVWFGR